MQYCSLWCSSASWLWNSVCVVYSHTHIQQVNQPNTPEYPWISQYPEYPAGLWLRSNYISMKESSSSLKQNRTTWENYFSFSLIKALLIMILLLLSPVEVSCESKMPDSWSDRMQESTSSRPVVSSSSMSFCPSTIRWSREQKYLSW